MRRLFRILFNALTVLSLLAALSLLGWRLFGHPLLKVDGYFILPLIAPPNPIYVQHFDLFDLPYWALLATSFVFPLKWLDQRLQATLVRWRLRRVDLCPVCGYYLHANVSSICPECGTPTTVKA